MTRKLTGPTADAFDSAMAVLRNARGALLESCHRERPPMAYHRCGFSAGDLGLVISWLESMREPFLANAQPQQEATTCQPQDQP